jgi:hypothetical protein
MMERNPEALTLRLTDALLRCLDSVSSDFGPHPTSPQEAGSLMTVP